MADRDPTAVEVHTIPVDLELAQARNGLTSKRLVDFDHIEIRDS
jgi:hypothetical protein